MASPSDRPPRRFGPYPEDAAQDAIYERIVIEGAAALNPYGAGLMRVLNDEIVALKSALAAREVECEALRRDGERYRWLKGRYASADFALLAAEHEIALIFGLPLEARVSADLDATIDGEIAYQNGLASAAAPATAAGEEETDNE